MSFRVWWRTRFYKRPISATRIMFLTGAFIFLNSMLLGVPNFGTLGPMKWLLLPNASCRYISNAPTNCWFYNLQEGLTSGWGSFYLVVLPMVMVASVLAIVLGRGWCGWLCPLGFTQYLISRFRAFMGLQYRELPYWAVAVLDHLKYAILFVMVLVAISIGIPALGLSIFGENLALPYCQVCPGKGVFTVLQQGLGIEPFATSLPWVAIGMLGLFLVASFFVRMFWCRVCPIGGFLALFNRRSLFWLRKDPPKCTKCRVCLRVCPMDIEEIFIEMEKENVTSPECIMCGRCVESCPENGALSFNYMGKELARSMSPAERREEREGRYQCPPELDGEALESSSNNESNEEVGT
ncbi:MAG: 4Fe-4S binding protein [Thermoplasmata archaeon]|nr:4Fe-4S binding protein [Thermoplasmata archaeon]